ncbi:uncharacterized protein LOC142325683 [Lycorma delicatula]|uniref:uncharacterized protein LOC142325683 n=1 Tax=Lycorma delicatula TaxID=130591 RepID=UPI003F5119EC
MWSVSESPEPNVDLKPAARITPRLRPRPKSACTVRPRRPKTLPRPSSALGLRRHEDRSDIRTSSRLETDEDPASARRKQQTPVAQYHRCLRLLGLVPNDSTHHGHRPDTKNVKPRVQTFLVRRTVSHDDIKEAVLKDLERSSSGCDKHDDHMNGRQTLAKAVYEEWYFNKLESTRQHRKKSCLQKRTDQWHQTRVKRERSEKSQEKFMEWVQRKNEQMKKERQLKNKSRTGQGRNKANAEASFNVWKEQKDKVLKGIAMEQNRLKRLQMDERSTREERRDEAEKAFQIWKKSVDDKLRMKQQEKERKKKEEKEDEIREAEEKRKNANAAFKCWKKNKDLEHQRKIKEIRKKEESANAARRQLYIERQQLAEEAFLKWLETIY